MWSSSLPLFPSRFPSSLVLLFIAISALSFLSLFPCVSSTWKNCGTVVRVPSILPVQPVLAYLHNRHYNRTICQWTFEQFELSYELELICFNMPRVNVHTCPMHCLRALDHPASHVYGSSPYHANSSICLAAIHGGVLLNEEGGGLFLNRYLPQDWSNSSTQTEFPFGSTAASFSNGVQSEEVPADWVNVPAKRTDYSWTVRSRGVVANQRQTAPFAPRFGHFHLRLSRIASHFIIGGTNGHDYFNDVPIQWPHYPHYSSALSLRFLTVLVMC